MTRRPHLVLLVFILITVLVQLGTSGRFDVQFGREPNTRYWTVPR